LTKTSSVIHEIEKWLQRYRLDGKNKSLILQVHPITAEKMREGFISPLTKIQLKYFIRLKIKEDEKMNPQMFKIYSKKTGEDLTEEFA
jgi:ribonuclease G